MKGIHSARYKHYSFHWVGESPQLHRHLMSENSVCVSARVCIVRTCARRRGNAERAKQSTTVIGTSHHAHRQAA